MSRIQENIPGSSILLAPAFFARAIVSSAAAVSCAIILSLTLMETIHRRESGFIPLAIAKPIKVIAELDIPNTKVAVLETRPSSSALVFAEELSPLNEEIDGIMELRRLRASKAVVAAKSCNISWMNRLIRQGVDVLSVDGNGETALGWAVRSNCQSVLSRLISIGAQGNTQEASGFSAIDWAFREGNLAVIKMFRSKLRS